MQKKRNIIISALACLLLTACNDDKCRKYSDFTCEQIQQANYNVYFDFPDGSEYFLGETQGLENCGNMASSYAAEKKLPARDWSHICCMIAKDSSCYEKHR